MGTKEYRCESERQIKIFADKMLRRREQAIQKMCRPDFELMRKDEDLSILIVEVKSLFKETLREKELTGYNQE